MKYGVTVFICITYGQLESDTIFLFILLGVSQSPFVSPLIDDSYFPFSFWIFCFSEYEKTRGKIIILGIE